MTISDFRSDTVTRPTPAMRRAMADAEVGDDVFEEDPTVRRLEEETAEILGFEAALFCPTGTMGNQICLRVHARSGMEVIADSRSHIFTFELGALASLSGLMPRPIEAPRGVLSAALVLPQIQPDLSFRARTGVIVIENTHNMAGGVVTPRAAIDGILALAAAQRLPVHLDGARLWNASVAAGLPEREMARGFSSAMVAFSKGLRAPAGSCVVGSAELIREARRVRKLFGGGMRQVGVLAAAARVALAEERSRLAEDHANCRRLAEGLGVDPAGVETNILLVETPDATRTTAALRDRGVLALPAGPTAMRFVTHADVGPSDVEKAIEGFHAAVRGGK
ncbi:Low-specificity L-threonine aldolase [Minicystis rosea]|nr:Low-specificity L-threonine aldolase [Minicystis rosea]